MIRRHFMSHAASQLLAFSIADSVLAMGEKRSGENYGASSGKSKPLIKIGKRSIEEIRDIFKHELYEKSIPLWKKDGVDWNYGGYLTSLPVKISDLAGWPYIATGDVQRDWGHGKQPPGDPGERVVKSSVTDKRLYHQGRILWLYSYFYTHIEKDEYFLRAAKVGYDFLTKYCMDDKYTWYTLVTREGKLITGFYDIFSCIYTTLGLGEYYNATGSEAARDLAVKSAYRIAEIILSPQYQAPGHGPSYDIIGTYREPGTRRLGIWMHFLSTLTPLLKYTEDPGLEKIARMVVRNILKCHYQPDMGLAYEFLQWDFRPYPRDYLSDDYLRAVDGFHSIESAWMCMDEALRVGSREMFHDGMEFGRSLIEKTWLERDGNQGLVRYYWPDEPDPFARANILPPYVMKEVFVFLLLVLEHSHEQWAVEWFDRAFSYSYETPLVFPCFDTLHNPRGLMFSLQVLERMIERRGRVSDFFEI